MFDPRPVIMHHEWGNQLTPILKWIVAILFVAWALDLVWIWWQGTRRER